MIQIINDKQLYIERLIHRYPEDLSIREKVSLSIDGLSNILVLYNDKEPIGFLVLDFFSNQNDNSLATIYNIYIEDMVYKKEITNILLKEAINIVKEEGFNSIGYEIDLTDEEYVNHKLFDDYLYFSKKGFILKTYKDKLYLIKQIGSNSLNNIA